MNKRTKTLVLGGVMVALSTVLSFIKILHMPQGGSISLCSMLPLMLYAYYCGTKWGLAAGFVRGVLDLLTGLEHIKGVTGGALLGMVFFDYLLAFTVLGFAGIFRKKIKNEGAAVMLGCLVGGMLRYLCSFLSGWIIWGEYADANFSPMLAGLDGQTLACLYSLLYNGSYMIPEIIITCVVSFFLVRFAGNQLKKLTEN